VYALHVLFAVYIIILNVYIRKVIKQLQKYTVEILYFSRVWSIFSTIKYVKEKKI
jgi:hypothetical protein